MSHFSGGESTPHIITSPRWVHAGRSNAPARVGDSAVRYSRRPGAFGSERWCYGSGRIVFYLDRHTKSCKLAFKIMPVYDWVFATHSNITYITRMNAVKPILIMAACLFCGTGCLGPTAPTSPKGKLARKCVPLSIKDQLALAFIRTTGSRAYNRCLRWSCARTYAIAQRRYSLFTEYPIHSNLWPDPGRLHL